MEQPHYINSPSYKSRQRYLRERHELAKNVLGSLLIAGIMLAVIWAALTFGYVG